MKMVEVDYETYCSLVLRLRNRLRHLQDLGFELDVEGVSVTAPSIQALGERLCAILESLTWQIGSERRRQGRSGS